MKTINNNIGKVIKFISIKLYGGRLKEVNIPRKKGNNENKNKGLIITRAGKIRFVKWARKEGMVA